MPRPFNLPEPPPLDEQRGQSYPLLVEVMQRLLAPDGCPWDREQTEQTLRRYVLEEACEVIDAIDSDDSEELRDELGDLALQVVFLSELGRRRGSFGPDDVVHRICEKLIRRHPHVFGPDQEDELTPSEVEVNWEKIKQQEKRNRPLLDSTPRSLSALRRAHEEQARAARVGFDWTETAEIRDKISEELDELQEALQEGDRDAATDEFGDLLFALTNWARHQQIDSEQALRGTCDKFRRRFGHIEKRVKAEHGDWPRSERGKATTGIALQELERYYQEAKADEAHRDQNDLSQEQQGQAERKAGSRG